MEEYRFSSKTPSINRICIENEDANFFVLKTDISEVLVMKRDVLKDAGYRETFPVIRFRREQGHWSIESRYKVVSEQDFRLPNEWAIVSGRLLWNWDGDLEDLGKEIVRMARSRNGHQIHVTAF